MFLVTTDYIEGKKFEMLGMVQGSTIQARHIGKDIGSGFRNLVGGEMKNYTEMMEDSRRIATERMVAQAQKLGADAVIGIRLATSAIVQGAAEVMVYGTAVRYL